MASSCSDGAGGQPVSGVAKQPIVYENIPIGYGFDSSDPGAADPRYSGTGVSCVLDENAKYDRVADFRATLFSQYVEQTVTERLDVSAGITGDLPLEETGFAAAVDNAVSFVSESQSEERTLIFALKVKTATVGFLNPPFAPDDGSFCESSTVDSIDEFLRVCGNKYLQKADMGGIVLIAVNYETLSEEQKIEASRSESVDVYGVELGIDAGFKQIRDAVGSSNTVYVWSAGLTPPGEAIGEGASESTMDALVEWSLGLTKDDGTLVLDQTFLPYSAPLLDSCGIGQEIIDLYDCAENFFRQARAIDADSVLARRIQYLEEVQSEPGNYRFASGTKVDDVSNFLQITQDCANAVNSAETQCRATVAQGDIEEICTECAIPETQLNGLTYSCGGEDLRGMADELFRDVRPKATPTAPAGPTVPLTINEDDLPLGSQEFSRNLELCTLSGMKGDFAGTGEQVSILPNPAPAGASIQTPTYEIAVKSGHPADDVHAKVKAFFHCSPYSSFFYNNSSTPPDFTTWLTESLQNQEVSLSSAQLDKIGALSGLSGEMAGHLEYGYVDQESDMEAKVDSNQGTMRGWFSFFGPPTSSGGATKFAADADSFTVWGVESSGETNEGSVKLPSSADAHCFLTDVRGEFDGHQEWVKFEIDNNGFYKLRYHSKNRFGFDAKPIKAKARCIAFDQT